jgi:hypothetical protein
MPFDGLPIPALCDATSTFAAKILCLCGYYGDTQPCTCAPGVVTKNQKRISDPLLDRIDIHIKSQAWIMKSSVAIERVSRLNQFEPEFRRRAMFNTLVFPKRRIRDSLQR